jgi:hypothetical protein
MSYIRDTNKLFKVTGILSANEGFSREFFYSHLRHQIPMVENSKEKLTNLFIAANSQRQGRNREETGIKPATIYFYQGIENEIKQIMGWETEKAHRHFLEWLCSIPGVEQKTANLFLKWLVMFNSDFEFNSINWSTWKPYLHVPLDRWVIRLMHKGYLDFCTQQYEQDFIAHEGEPNPVNLSISKEVYWKLQDELQKALLPSKQYSIVLDNLWFVGFLFCSVRPLFYEVCWLKEECAYGQRNSLDLDKMPPGKSKAELRKEKDEEKHREKALIKEWINQNPEKAEQMKKQLNLQSNSPEN